MPTLNKNQLPKKPSLQLEAAIKGWNKNYGTKVKALGWSYEGRVSSPKERKDAVLAMTSPDRVWMPHGDPAKSVRMTAQRVADHPEIPVAVLAKWQRSVGKLVTTGLHIMKIEWQKGTKKFSTVCVADGNALIYDTMLFNASLVTSHHSCFYMQIQWIWGSKRGEITADLQAKCQNGVPVVCNSNCNAWMTLGDAKINCSTKKVKNCCVLSYSYAWGTPLVTIKVSKNGFTLSTSGIGSSGMGSGTCSDCCPESAVRETSRY